MTPRCASYVVSPDVTFWVTTIFWENDLTGMSWNESAVRDLEARDPKGDAVFTLIQHDIWPLERGHTRVVEALKLGMKPGDVAKELLSPNTTLGLLRAALESEK